LTLCALEDAKAGGIQQEQQLGLSTDRNRGTVKGAEHLGVDTFPHLDVDDIGPITERADGEFGPHHGDKVFFSPDESNCNGSTRGLAISGSRWDLKPSLEAADPSA
jgi:multiple sugar transport system ATP-binding protein